MKDEGRGVAGDLEGFVGVETTVIVLVEVNGDSFEQGFNGIAIVQALEDGDQFVDIGELNGGGINLPQGGFCGGIANGEGGDVAAPVRNRLAQLGTNCWG